MALGDSKEKKYECGEGVRPGTSPIETFLISYNRRWLVWCQSQRGYEILREKALIVSISNMTWPGVETFQKEVGECLSA